MRRRISFESANLIGSPQDDVKINIKNPMFPPSAGETNIGHPRVLRGYFRQCYTPAMHIGYQKQIHTTVIHQIEKVCCPPMTRIALATLLLVCSALTVHSQQQPSQLLLHAAQCLEAKKFLPSLKSTSLTFGYYFDEKSYPGEEVIYVVNYTTSARSSGLVFALFLREHDGRQEFNIQNNASFVSSTKESSGISFENPPLGGTWTQLHLASAITEIAKRPKSTIRVKELSSVDEAVSCVAYTDPDPGQSRQNQDATSRTKFLTDAQANESQNQLSDPYKIWLEDDVVYIIMDAERNIFLALQTNEEREAFIEQFWLRRNPDPSSEENLFKEEHFRRIAYANEHFASSVPGWKTDRGHIYILWGNPDSVEAHPHPSAPVRRREGPGGVTADYPFEVWQYKHMEGIGDNIRVEFVDSSKSNEYRLAADPEEKPVLFGRTPLNPAPAPRNSCICDESERRSPRALDASGAQEVGSGESVVNAMHARYENVWYETVTFTQKSTTYNPDGTTKVETWYEAASLPGKLRIDYGQPSEGNGLVLADGNATSVQAGKEGATRPLLNLLLVLGFDVYRQAPEVTVAQLKHEGIDVTKFHEEMWNGEPVYVVGADKGDLKSKQFWVEKKRLLFVRLLQPYQRDLSKTTDTRFVDYREAGKGMIAARVEVYREEKVVFTEDYTEIKIDVKLDAGTFDPKQFNTTHWEK
jgi:GWxTD domain-containing protein